MHIFLLEEIKRKKEKVIRLISKRELQVLIDMKLVDKTALKDIAVTSKNKNSRGKRYYAKDNLAFYAWWVLGLNPENDKDFQLWKKNNNRKCRN